MPAQASALPCAGNCTSLFDGQAGVHSQDTFGVRGTIAIPVAQPALCTGTVTFSDEWTMVTGYKRYATHNRKNATWAQIGYGRDILTDGLAPGPDRLLSFAQFTLACKPDCSDKEVRTNVFPAPSLGSSVTYSNYQRSADGKIHMYANNVHYLKTGYTAQSTWDPAWAAQFFNETYDQNDDVWGTSPDRSDFFRLQRYLSNGGIDFISVLSAGNDNPTRWHQQSYNPGVGGLGFKNWND